MKKLMWEIEITNDLSAYPDYLYIETDEDIEIDIGEESDSVTHITCIDTDIGVDADLIIRRRID